MLRMVLECIGVYLKSDMICKVLIFVTLPPNTLHIYVSEDVSLRGYFSKAKEFRERILRKRVFCFSTFYNLRTCLSELVVSTRKIKCLYIY
jgi:hypothetical protein